MDGPKHKRIVLTMHMLSYGGTDRVAVHLANGFAQIGHSVTLLLFCRDGEAHEPLSQLLKPDVRIVWLGERGGSRTRDLLRLFPQCLAWLKRERPDTILSTCNNMNWITALAAKRSCRDAKVYLKTTNPIVREKDSGLGGFLRKRGYALAFQSADGVLALCEVERQLLSEQFPKQSGRFHAVANPYVKQSMIKPQGPVNGQRDKSEKLILGVGRFENQKNMAHLIRSFALLEDAGARLAILGEGSLKAECERLITELNLEHRVTLPGFVSDPTPWFHRAQVFALSSVYEGFPAVVLEAMASRCAIVATDCFLSAKTLLSDVPSGFVVEDWAPESYANALHLALNTQSDDGLLETAQLYSISAGIESHRRLMQL